MVQAFEQTPTVIVALTALGEYSGPGEYAMQHTKTGALPDMFPVLSIGDRTFERGEGATAVAEVAADGSGTFTVTGLLLPAGYGYRSTMTLYAMVVAHFVYPASDHYGVGSLFYLTRSPDGDWIGPVSVAKATAETQVSWEVPGLAVDAQGNPYAAWRQYGPAVIPGFTQPDVAFAGPALAANGGESILSQTVAVPAGMVHPTLSFVYQSRGAAVGAGQARRHAPANQRAAAEPDRHAP